ncbi:MAG TPA: hypothetical protein VHQ90_13845 [Thermoanaerobaculia bacterium]|nr:hypothetical protein [Thermoanaerobaculia bacterium]
MRKSPFALVALFLLILPTLAVAHGAGHVMGTIAAFDQEHLEIKTTAGKTVSVKLGSATKYFRGPDKASAADLAVGMRAMVHLAADKSAAEVHLPAAPKPGS